MINNQILAFPSHGTMGELVQEGMTLRDYFAAKAINSLIAYELTYGAYRHICPPSAVQIADRALMIADAMMEARNEQI